VLFRPPRWAGAKPPVSLLALADEVSIASRSRHRPLPNAQLAFELRHLGGEHGTDRLHCLRSPVAMSLDMVTVELIEQSRNRLLGFIEIDCSVVYQYRAAASRGSVRRKPASRRVCSSSPRKNLEDPSASSSCHVSLAQLSECGLRRLPGSI
jgi:hypothetical protein